MILLLMVAAIATTPIAVTPPARCDKSDNVRPAAGAEAQPRRLDELPRADHYLTVLRTVDSCPAPVIVRYGIGEAGKQ